MMPNYLRPYLYPILRKNENKFRTNRSTLGQIRTLGCVIENVEAKTFPAVFFSIDFPKVFDSIHQTVMKEIFLAYGILS